MAISQNAILAKWQSQKTLLLHFSMNFSETFGIDENMDFVNNFVRGILSSKFFWNPKSKFHQDTLFAPTFNGHNSAIFYPIMTSDHTKIISS